MDAISIEADRITRAQWKSISAILAACALMFVALIATFFYVHDEPTITATVTSPTTVEAHVELAYGDRTLRFTITATQSPSEDREPFVASVAVATKRACEEFVE